MGIDDVSGNLGSMFFYLGTYFICWGTIYSFQFIAKKSSVNPYLFGALGCLLVFGVGWNFTKAPFWFQLFKPVPIVVLVIGIFVLITMNKERKSGQISNANLFNFVFIIFSLLLLLKIFLNPVPNYYTFGLLLPATLVVVKFIVYDLPGLVQEKCGTSLVFHMVSSALVLYLFCGFLLWSKVFYDIKGLKVGHGWDQVFAISPIFDGRDQQIKSALSLIEEEMGQNDNFVAFPSGAMLNYLTRRENPIGYTFVDPFAIDLFDEGSILNALQQSPPDYIIFVNIAFHQFENALLRKGICEVYLFLDHQKL